ncbi:uncharacterized protein J3R85_006738 [Psidium guajava]|nr:uncharacterized protein J3R85_006738 [Psidium guajava]
MSSPASSLSSSLSSRSSLSPPSPSSSPLSSLSLPSSSLPSSSSSFSPPENEPTRLQVYSRKMKLNPELDQVPLSEPLSGNDITHPFSNEPELSDLDLPIALRKATRKCTLHPISQFVSYQRLSTQHKAFITALDSIIIPNSVHEAFENRNWIQAMMAEMNALKKNDIWEVVTLPKGKQPMGCKWVYTLKYKADGSLERCKARLVTKGYTQTYGVDYQETFAPVAKMNTVRMLLSLATIFGWSLQQFDVKNAFLHGDLEEEVFMEPPPGFDKDFGNNQECRDFRRLSASWAWKIFTHQLEGECWEISYNFSLII